MEAEYLTTKQVADLLQVTERTVEKWRERRDGPPYSRLGSLIRYSRTEVEKWVADNQIARRKQPAATGKAK
jgi:excisionase family DNA binding protein